MSGAFKLDQYIKAAGLKVNNTQKLLSYYRELFQLYTDAGMPDNKFIYFLEENLHTTPFTTIPPEIYDFMSLKQHEINLLVSYIRIYKKLSLGKGKYKILEFPFENKVDFSSFADPLRYLNNDSYPFASPRFMGPIAEMKGVTINFSGADGKGNSKLDKYYVDVSFELIMQDAKVLFKNWTEKHNELQYRDLFASPRELTNNYQILLEIGYNTPPDNPSMDYSKIKNVAKHKRIIPLTPSAAATEYDFKQDGSLSLKTTLYGNFDEAKNIINILDNKYYSKIKKKNNIPTLDESYVTSIYDLNTIEDRAPALKADVKKQVKQDPPKVSEKPKKETKAKEKIKKDRKILQLANNVKAIPAVFPFIAALYEADLIYYFEIDNNIYKDYIKKIADGIPVDITDINIVPKKKKKLRLTPNDLLEKQFGSNSKASTLNIKKLSDLKKDKADNGSEKVKFFYFGDLVEIMLNNQEGTGVGQDLDLLGKDEFKFLFGQIMWVKNATTKILYNILSTPISLDMFLHELNIEIFSKGMKHMTLQYFFSNFMKRFFDNVINSTEKTKTGQDQQYYSGEKVYNFDKLQFLIHKEKDSNKGKFKKKLYNLRPLASTADVTTVNLIAAMPIDSGIMTNQKRKKRNIPTLYLGGVDKGPLGDVKITTETAPGYIEAANRKSKAILEAASKSSIGETIESSVLIPKAGSVQFTLIGNCYLNLNDTVFVDSRFVDGGFFDQRENKIFLTGAYRITKMIHKVENGRWIADYTGILIEEDFLEDNAFNSNSGLIPDDQQSNLVAAANTNQSNILNSTVEGTVSKPSESPSKSSNPKVGQAPAPKAGNIVPTSVPKK